MRRRGISLAEVSLAVGVSAAVAATAATAGSFLMGKSKMATLEEHAQNLLRAVDGYSAAGGETNQPYPMPAIGAGALLNTSLKPFMSQQTNPAQYWNPFQNATHEVLAMANSAGGNYCTDGGITLNSATAIANTAYYGKVLYCYDWAPATFDNKLYINQKGTVLAYDKYALVTVDQNGWLTQVIGR